MSHRSLGLVPDLGNDRFRLDVLTGFRRSSEQGMVSDDTRHVITFGTVSLSKLLGFNPS